MLGDFFNEITKKRSMVGKEWAKNEVPSRGEEASFPSMERIC
jgi:hypothetical protein